VIPAAASVEVSVLLKVAEAALVAGMGITIAFSLVIWGSVRASDHARDGHGAIAVLHGCLAAVSLAASVAAIVYGLEILTSK
jgi:hypothetical protein